MNPEQKIMLRENLLMQLSEARPFGALSKVLKRGAQFGGFYLSDDEISAELEILAKRGLVVAETDKLAIEQVPHWKITAEGLKTLDSRGY